jgi:large subunit ribosomal protein L3
MEKDGYESIQLGYKNKRVSLANKPELGHVAKAGSNPKRYLKEVRGQELYNFEVGQEITVNIFSEGEIVDVTGTSKGKGFAGIIKRHNQGRGPMGHGSHYHRGPGSMGSIDPNHVRPGKNLPGHMGHETVTIQNLEIVKVDAERNVLLIKGSVPGPKKGLVFVKRAVKSEAVAPLNPADFVVEDIQDASEEAAE